MFVLVFVLSSGSFVTMQAAREHETTKTAPSAVAPAAEGLLRQGGDETGATAAAAVQRKDEEPDRHRQPRRRPKRRKLLSRPRTVGRPKETRETAKRKDSRYDDRADGGGSDSEYVETDESDEDMEPLSRKRSNSTKTMGIGGFAQTHTANGETNRSKPQEPRRGQQQQRQRWTELTAIGQILSDATYSCWEQRSCPSPSASSGTVLEQQQQQQHLQEQVLTRWVDRTQSVLHEQSRLLLDNVVVVAALQEQRGQIEKLRDDLLIVRTQTRRLQQETATLEAQQQAKEREATSQRAASTFLTALQELASKCRE